MVGSGFSKNANPVLINARETPHWQDMGNHFYDELYPQDEELLPHGRPAACSRQHVDAFFKFPKSRAMPNVSPPTAHLIRSSSYSAFRP